MGMILLKSDCAPRERKIILEYEVKEGTINFKNQDKLDIVHFSKLSLITVDFIIDQYKNLFLGYEHYFLSNQAKHVMGAGTLILDTKGILKIITNYSGHYKPSAEESINLKNMIEEKGIDISSAEFVKNKIT